MSRASATLAAARRDELVATVQRAAREALEASEKEVDAAEGSTDAAEGSTDAAEGSTDAASASTSTSTPATTPATTTTTPATTPVRLSVPEAEASALARALVAFFSEGLRGQQQRTGSEEAATGKLSAPSPAPPPSLLLPLLSSIEAAFPLSLGRSGDIAREQQRTGQLGLEEAWFRSAAGAEGGLASLAGALPEQRQISAVHYVSSSSYPSDHSSTPPALDRDAAAEVAAAVAPLRGYIMLPPRRPRRRNKEVEKEEEEEEAAAAAAAGNREEEREKIASPPPPPPPPHPGRPPSRITIADGVVPEKPLAPADTGGISNLRARLAAGSTGIVQIQGRVSRK